MFKGFGDLIQQAGKMREQMTQMQESLAHRTVEVSSGAGMVKVVANGKHQILSVTIDPEVVKKADKEMLEAPVLTAVNEANKASQAMVSEEMGKMTGSLGPLQGLLQGMS